MDDRFNNLLEYIDDISNQNKVNFEKKRFRGFFNFFISLASIVLLITAGYFLKTVLDNNKDLKSSYEVKSELIDSSKNILNCNDIYLVLNDKNRIALFDNNIKMLTKYEIIYDDSLDVFKLDNNYVISLNDEFYFVNDRVTHYDGSFFEYNGSYAYYLNNVIYLVDNNLNVVKEISYSNDISIEDITVFPFIISVKIMNGDITEVKNYDYNFESVKAKENIVYKGANFFVYLNNYL